MDSSARKGTPSQPLLSSQNRGSANTATTAASTNVSALSSSIINNITSQRVRFAEEGGASAAAPVSPVSPVSPPPQTYQAPPRRELKSPPVPHPPSVFWEDNDNDTVNGTVAESMRGDDPALAHYTFYREGTPPPPDVDGHEKGSSQRGLTPGSAAAGAAAASRGFGFSSFGGRGGDASTWSGSDGNELSPTARKRIFWILVAVGVVVLAAIAIGVGVGLGVGTNRAGQSEQSVDGSSSSPSAILGTTPTPTDTENSSLLPVIPESITSMTSSTTAPLPLPTSYRSGSRPNPDSDCPAVNNTLYTVPGSTKTYRRLCGIDYSGPDGATDLKHVYTVSMAECMNICASYDKCTACGWGFLAGDTDGEHRCYMKTDLKKSHVARQDWCFALLV